MLNYYYYHCALVKFFGPVPLSKLYNWVLQEEIVYKKKIIIMSQDTTKLV